MDGFKPLLEIHGKSLVENGINLFKEVGVQEIVTVLGYRSNDLIPIVERAGSCYVINENYQDGMFSSIQKGAAKLKNTCDAGVFVRELDHRQIRLSPHSAASQERIYWRQMRRQTACTVKG